MFWREGFALNVVKKTEEKERIETNKLEGAEEKGKVEVRPGFVLFGSNLA